MFERCRIVQSKRPQLGSVKLDHVTKPTSSHTTTASLQDVAQTKGRFFAATTSREDQARSQPLQLGREIRCDYLEPEPLLLLC